MINSQRLLQKSSEVYLKFVYLKSIEMECFKLMRDVSLRKDNKSINSLTYKEHFITDYQGSYWHNLGRMFKNYNMSIK